MEKKKDKLLMEIIQENTFFMKFVEEKYEQDQIRINLLQDILQRMEEDKNEELACKIYLYGSMLKQQDLIARQLFLWLLEMTERVTG